MTMTVVVVVDSAPSARMASRLVQSDTPVIPVVADDAGVRRMWTRLLGQAGVPDVDALPSAFEPVRVLAFGSRPAAELLEGRDGAARFVVSLSTGSPYELGDPLWWAVLHGLPVLTLHVTRVDVGFEHEACVAQVKVDIAELAYADAAAAAAEALVSVLSEADSHARVCAKDCRLPHRPNTAVIPSAVDWNRDAAHVVRMIRAGDPDVAPVRTWLRGFPVTLSGARVQDTAALSVTPGTIVRITDDEVLVAARTGIVAVAEARDLIGRLDLSLLSVGIQFGVDPHDEVTELRRRLTDVEEVLKWVTRDRETALEASA